MRYKIVFSDIDGTLLNEHRELSEPTIEQIKKLKDKIPFILVSARMPAAMKHLQKELEIEDLPVICYNGGLVLVNDEVVSSTEIPLEIVKDIVDVNSEINCHLSLYHQDEWYVPEFDEWAQKEERNTKVKPEVKPNYEVVKLWEKQKKGTHKIMAMGEESKIEKIKVYLKEKYDNQLHLYRSKSTYLEIANKRISKYSAIEMLLKDVYNLKPEEAIAFGDNYNDVEMLKKVGYGVAVGNARQEAKDVCQVHAAKSIEDGVAKSLMKIFKED